MRVMRELGPTSKKAPTPIIHTPYLEIEEDIEFERRVATPPSDIVFRKLLKWSP